MVLRRRVVEATGRRVALVLEEVVRYALLDIVGVAREDGQRLVLDFPAEARQAAVIRIAVFMAGNPESGLRVRGCHHVAQDRRVIDGFDKTAAL